MISSQVPQHVITGAGRFVRLELCFRDPCSNGSFTKIVFSLAACLFYSIMALQPFVGPRSLFSFFIYTQSVELLGQGDQPVARPLPTHRTTQTQNKCTPTSMSRVVFEPTTPVFERAKTVHASDRAATVNSSLTCLHWKKGTFHRRC
jgi:hypothetical protein